MLEELSLLKTHETILQKTWIIDKHTFNFETVLKNPKTEIIYWTMCKYLKAQLSLDYQYWTISDNIWLSSQYLTWCNNISTYLIFIKNWTYLDAPRQYFKSSSNSSMILLFWNFLVSHLTGTVTQASNRQNLSIPSIIVEYYYYSNKSIKPMLFWNFSIPFFFHERVLEELSLLKTLM